MVFRDINNSVIPISAGAHERRSGLQWLQWLLGAAVLAAVIVIALRWTEAREIAAMVNRVQPMWFVLAAALQLSTYVVQGAFWRALARRLTFALSRRQAFRLSLAKLFIDQALPAAGVSGAVAVAAVLERRGMDHGGVLAGVFVNTSAYFLAYVICLAVAVPLVPLHGAARSALWIAASLFVIASTVLAVAVLVLPTHAPPAWLAHLAKRRLFSRSIRLIHEVDHPLVRDRTLLTEATVYQALIVLLDAATMWSLVKGLGTNATIASVFGCFMVSNLFRTLGILPGGLGTFEATSVLTLQAIGVPVPVAL
ncbi:MAG: lysylphosphatidylglycerol synthase transmembrane domain-containing protein, partial [Steroidobacteraceae bacterium]